MKICNLILRLMAPLLVFACLSLQTQSALASGTSTSDLKILAEEGNSLAQRILGERLSMGIEGAAQDMNQAVLWWQKAADKGDLVAQYYLGQMYSQGVVVPQDWVQSHMWFSLVGSSKKETVIAMQHKKLAEINKKAAETKMTPKQIEEAKALAQEWLTKHSQ